MPLRVNKRGEDRVEIEGGLGETSVVDLEIAKQRLENLKNQKNSFVDQNSWRARVDAAERAVALLDQADRDKKKSGGLKMINVIKKAAAMLIK
jgi:hypothetical protein